MPQALKNLINSISYLPGIGEKTATKLAFFLLKSNKSFLNKLSSDISNIKEDIGLCENCFSVCDKKSKCCEICNNPSRKKNLIAVVEDYLDLVTIEESSCFDGVYHVLGGAISPINGVFIGDLKLKELFNKIEKNNDNIEIILATNPNIEGEATSNYIIEEINKRELKYKTDISKLSRGVSSGYLEYADNISIINAIKDRKKI